MKRVQVGLVARRTKDGRFLPPEPIYRMVPETKQPAKPPSNEEQEAQEGDIMNETIEGIPMQDIVRVFAKQFWRYKKAQQQAERERKRREQKAASS